MRGRLAPLTSGLAVAGLASTLAACAPDAMTAGNEPSAPSLARAAAASAATGQSDLAAVRAATARYHRVDAALADGYVSTNECAASPSGAMGIHYVNPALMGPPAPGGDATLDPLRPEVLLYEPQKNGRLQLVGVEYLVWRAAWAAAHPRTAPSLFGQPFVQSFGPGAHGLPDHYELHVWIWQHNPSGMFAQWNPTVTCDHAS